MPLCIISTYHVHATNRHAVCVSETTVCLYVYSRRDLSAQCSAQLFDEEVGMAESIDFQIPMKTACRQEIGTFCKDVPHGHARVIRLAPQQFSCKYLYCIKHSDKTFQHCIAIRCAVQPELYMLDCTRV